MNSVASLYGKFNQMGIINKLLCQRSLNIISFSGCVPNIAAVNFEKYSQQSWENENKGLQHNSNNNNNSNSNNDNSNDKNSQSNNSKWIAFLKKSKYSLVSLFGILIYFYKTNQNNEAEEEIFYCDIFKYIKTKEINSIIIVKDNSNITTPSSSNTYTARIYLNNSKILLLNIANYDKFIIEIEEAQRSLSITKESFIPIKLFTIDKSKTSKREIVDSILWFSLWGIIAFIASNFEKVYIRPNRLTLKQRSNSFTDSKAREFIKGQSNIISLKDVAGLHEAKSEIIEFIDFLKNPSKYLNLGAKIPHGALLIGPPGTGKTLLAKAIAGEANVPFFSISGSEFDEMYIGVGPARVRSLFKMAKQRSPCIIFIDELDSVGSKRGIKAGGENDERKKTLNQLLVEMDGFHSNNKIVVLGATNCPDVLDNALLRPGRFDRKIELSLPDKRDRKEIFQLYLSNIKLNQDKTIKEYASRLSSITPGFSGADIANLVNEAAIVSARENKVNVDMKSFDKASERILAGFEMKKTLSKKEKRIVAFHESGHCIINWFSFSIFPVIKISIIPRSKGMLGFNLNLPSSSYLHTKQNILDIITSSLGGRFAEELFLGITTTGATDDLMKANNLAREMVMTYGMSKLGLVSYRTNDKNSFSIAKQYSEQRERDIEEATKEIIEQCTVKAKEVLIKNREKLYSLVDNLLEKETLGEEELKIILGDRPAFKQEVNSDINRSDKNNENIKF